MTFEEILETKGMLVYKTRGTSMKPMLTQNRDIVIIEPVKGELKRYDVPLYRRGSQYVLHRVLGVSDDTYLIRGDNTFVIETVPKDAVIGVLTGFKRKKRQYDVNDKGYMLYVKLWTAIYPIRYKKFKLRQRIVALLRKMGLLPIIKKMLGR